MLLLRETVESEGGYKDEEMVESEGGCKDISCRHGDIVVTKADCGATRRAIKKT
jgi:hypothetical protein